MNPTPEPDWEGIRIAYEQTSERLGSLAKRNGVYIFTIVNRARAEGWQPRPDGSTAAPRASRGPARKSSLSTHGAVQAVIDRMMAAVVRRLAILEDQLATTQTIGPQDAERIDRSMRIIMQNFEKARKLDAEHKQARKSVRSARSGAASAAPVVDAALLAAQRQVLAERIELFHARWRARRAAAGLDGPGNEPVDHRPLPEMAAGGPPRADAAAPG